MYAGLFNGNHVVEEARYGWFPDTSSCEHYDVLL
jgi:hypothetical protein